MNSSSEVASLRLLLKLQTTLLRLTDAFAVMSTGEEMASRARSEVQELIGVSLDFKESSALSVDLLSLDAAVKEFVSEVDVRLHEAAAQRRISNEREAALRDANDFTRLALTAVGGIGVWTYEVATDQFFADAEIARVYGLDSAKAANGILREEFLANVIDEDMAALRATMAGGLVRSGDLELEYRLRHADGSIHWVLSRGHTYFDESGNPIRRTGIGIDMTRQRQLEEQLRQSQKLESIGQLTGGIAHDFNNSLSTIGISVDMLSRKLSVSKPSELQRYLDTARKAIDGAASLTHRLLAFSRKQMLDSHAVDINRQTLELEEMLRRTLGENIHLALELHPGLWAAHTDPHQFENAILNLAINARDAMPDGGVLKIETGQEVLDAMSLARPPDMATGEYVVVRVSDTGSGMPPEVLQRAFDPFFTTKPAGHGTGLGLSMIYGFAKQTGGTVSISSAVKEGTTVTIYLPRAKEHVELRPEIVSHIPAILGTGERVLVVEDQADLRNGIVEVLEEHGFSATGVRDASAALDALAAGELPRLMITDVGLPGINGRYLADQVRRLIPSLPILFITGYVGESSVRSDFLGPGMDMLEKPLATEQLILKAHRMTRRDEFPKV